MLATTEKGHGNAIIVNF